MTKIRTTRTSCSTFHIVRNGKNNYNYCNQSNNDNNNLARICSAVEGVPQKQWQKKQWKQSWQHQHWQTEEQQDKIIANKNNLASMCNTLEQVAQKQKQQNQENGNRVTWPASAALCKAFHPVHFSPSPLMSAPCEKHTISRKTAITVL